MKISVIVPVYNIARYIGECIESIINQSYTPYELILVDDGSSDRSCEICESYSKHYTWIRVIHQNNYGVSAARNIGVLKSTGDYLIFVDGDDWLHPDCLQSYSKLIDKYGEVDYIHWRQTIVYPDGNKEICPDNFLKNIDVIGKNGKTVFAQYTSVDKCIWLGIRGVFRRDFLISNQLQNNSELRYAEDEEFMIRVFSLANSVLVNEFPGYFYRANRGGSLMSTFTVDKGIQQLSVYKEWNEKLCGEGHNDESFNKALRIELNRRVWNLYNRCLNEKSFKWRDEQVWLGELKKNRELFYVPIFAHLSRKARFIVKVLGIPYGTMILWIRMKHS